MEEKNEIINNPEESMQELDNTSNESASEHNVAIEAPAVLSQKVQENADVKKPHKRLLVGKVTSNKPDKSIVVSVETQVMHPLYKKYYKVTKKVMAHDEENTCNTGDTVRIKEHRPLSAKKRWILDDVIQRAK